MLSLRNVLIINSLSSGITGIGLMAFAPFIATIFGVSQVQAFQGTGIFLLAFALLVFYVSRQKLLSPSQVRIIITLDLLWVAGSLAIVGLQLFSLSNIGYIEIAVIAAWVAAMAYLQWRGLKEIR